MTVTADRLAEAMKDRGIDQSRLAREIGVTQGTISLILLGKTVRSRHLPAIAHFLEVSLTWLLGYDDDKYPAGPEQVLLGPRERRLVELYREIGSVEQLVIEEICAALAYTRALQERRIDMMASIDAGETALAQMFEGLLRTIDRSAPLGEQAQSLAQALPIGLSQLQDAIPSQPMSSDPAARPATPATPAPARP